MNCFDECYTERNLLNNCKGCGHANTTKIDYSYKKTDPRVI